MTTLKGHGLLREGRPFAWRGPAIGYTFAGPSGLGRGLCSCGEASLTLPSNAARRRWHNEHKDSLR